MGRQGEQDTEAVVPRLPEAAGHGWSVGLALLGSSRGFQAQHKEAGHLPPDDGLSFFGTEQKGAAGNSPRPGTVTSARVGTVPCVQEIS